MNLDDAALKDLRSKIRGDVIDPHHPGYDRARVVWNARINRKPALIIRCEGTPDVVMAVRFARKHADFVCVRGGGHDIAGNSVCDDGIVIDLSAMKEIVVDPIGHVAVAQAGLTWAEFDQATQRHGLASPGGQCSSTGIGGVTLGGGFGWLARAHGLSVDNLISATLVTADGDVVRASATMNADLFWGLRGGGGNFGVVTNFEFRLHPVSDVIVRRWYFAEDQLAHTMILFDKWCQRSPDNVGTMLLITALPAIADLPRELHGKLGVQMITCAAGALSTVGSLSGWTQQTVSPIAESVVVMPYLELQRMFDRTPLDAMGKAHHIRSHFFGHIDGVVADAISSAVRSSGSPQHGFAMLHLGGAVARVAESATAVAHRESTYFGMFQATWRPDEDPAPHIAWTARASSAVLPFSGLATYPNFIDADEPDRVRATFGPRKMSRLTGLKRTWDPDNFFRMNKNIAP